MVERKYVFCCVCKEMVSTNRIQKHQTTKKHSWNLKELMRLDAIPWETLKACTEQVGVLKHSACINRGFVFQDPF